HVGNFGGPVIRAAWLIFGLAPPVLVVTGFLMWWTRVVRPRWLAFRRDRPQASVEAPAQP
ncbi:MAG TPA: PepSY-associated TM helix domain-containing protein, partial [Vicinamibacterales bacterium]|nr:PepSY-associated TM helix domain-containing protein [Vicinamibacterales bacterium]